MAPVGYGSVSFSTVASVKDHTDVETGPYASTPRRLMALA
jgi:hypothetical protein